MKDESRAGASPLGLIGSIFGLGVALGITGIAGVTSVSSLPAWADPPNGPPLRLVAEDHGPDRDRDRDREHDRDRDREHGRGAERGERRDARFEDRDRVALHGYYVEYEQRGHCLPGLVRTPDGCVPPRHARAWHVGERLPREVVYYEVPPELAVRLTPPPDGYRYVRVASDILMIAAGTGIVASAIEDLER